jgi:anthranilate synthase component 2
VRAPNEPVGLLVDGAARTDGDDLDEPIGGDTVEDPEAAEALGLGWDSVNPIRPGAGVPGALRWSAARIVRNIPPGVCVSFPFRDRRGVFMLLMIDNYDSFTYNLVQYLGELGVEVRVYRNDELGVQDVARLAPERIVISPGPCTPAEAGISVPLIKAMAGRVPILGVCLGHQSIGEAFGGRIVKAREVMHGKTSPVYHAGVGVFSGLETPFQATRYHSLVVEQATLPECLEVTAWTQTGEGERDEIMGLRHREYRVQGVQFHPESILTRHGHDLLRNFIEDR